MRTKAGSFFSAKLEVDCPKCKRKKGHWCRDEKGKCITPHTERAKAAMDLMMSAFGMKRRTA